MTDVWLGKLRNSRLYKVCNHQDSNEKDKQGPVRGAATPGVTICHGGHCSSQGFTESAQQGLITSLCASSH